MLMFSFRGALSLTMASRGVAHRLFPQQRRNLARTTPTMMPEGPEVFTQVEGLNSRYLEKGSNVV